MQNALLTTKMHMPQPRPDVVSRPSLMSILDKGVSGELTLVSAPAGYGKTTLVSCWAGALALPIAWLSLDEGDNDGTRFISYLYTALHSANSGFDPQGLPIPPSMLSEHIEPVATAVLNELASNTKGLILILDDYHCIESDLVHGLVRFLIEHLPEQVHICLLTRADPPLPLSRWRGLGYLQEIRAADLRFKGDEIRLFLDQAANSPLTADSIDVIEAKTEGWITGLRLVALSLSRQDDVSRFVRSFSGSHEYIADYLTDEVIAGQPEDVQSFMLQTSILDHLAGDLCDAVTGRDGSQTVLEVLERQNLFLIPLDDDRRWYRYHPLFADLLRKRLYQTSPARPAELCARAGRWYEQQGLINEAIHYALAVDNGSRVISLVEQHILDTILQGEFYQAQTWLDAVPQHVRYTRPVLCAAEAWISIRNLLTGRVHELISLAERLMQDHKDSEDPGTAALVEGHIATLKAAVARTEGRSPLEQQELIRDAFEVVPEGDHAIRGMLNLRLGLSYLDLGYEQEADQAFQQVIATGETGNSHYNIYTAVYARTVIAHLQGRLHDVRTICEETLHNAASTVSVPWQKVAVHGFAHTALGLVQLEWNDLDAAEYHLRRGLSLNAASSVTELQVKGGYALGRLMIARGEQPIPVDQRKLRSGALPGLAIFAEALQAHLWVMSARVDGGTGHSLDRAAQWADGQSLGPVEGSDQDWQIRCRLIYVRVLLALSKTHNEMHNFPDLTVVVPVLDDLQETYGAHGWIDRVIEILIVKALVLDTLGETMAAQESLASALALAEPRRYTRIFLDEGETMGRLLYSSIQRGGATSAYAGRLLAQYSQSKIGTSSKKSAPAGNLIEPLTPREIEVLALIADGLTNQEIGRDLSISLGTVKRHTANINGKLDAHTRTQAVAVARSLNILD